MCNPIENRVATLYLPFISWVAAKYSCGKLLCFTNPVWACFSQLALAEKGPSLSLPVDIKANTKNQASELSKHVNRIKDLKLTIQIRKILSEDAELSQLNIGVSVKDGILRLWGPVPDSSKMEKSLKKVANVKLIFDIKNEMYIGVLEDIPEPLFIKE